MKTPTATPKPDFKPLHDQIKDSSDKNRQFFIAYLVLMVYVQATTFSTTDGMLLFSDQGMKLPLIDIVVPLLGFYWAIPLIALALHFNFLQNLEAHHYKLMQWRHAFPDSAVPRSRVQAFLFDYATLDSKGVMRCLIKLLNSFLCFYLGPATLAIVLWRMTDYQSPLLTFWHFFAFVANCVFVWRTRKAFLRNAEAEAEDDYKGRGQKSFALARKKNSEEELPVSEASRIFSLLKRSAYCIVVSSCILIVSFQFAFCLFVACCSSETFLCVNNLWNHVIDAYPRVPKEWIELFIPRITLVGVSSASTIDPARLKAISEFTGASDKPLAVWVATSGSGPNFQNRNLRGAVLIALPLVGAQFSNAQLEGTHFTFSYLQGATFRKAALMQANFQGADLQGASFDGARLWDAYFTFANLNSATFEGASAPGAHFTYSLVRFADFTDSNLAAAIFGIAEMQGANLRGTKLLAAEFGSANLQAANFSGAQIAGANFYGAKLQKAIDLNNQSPIGKNQISSTSIAPIDMKEMSRFVDEDLRFRHLGFGEIPDPILEQIKNRRPLTLNDLPKSDEYGAANVMEEVYCIKPNWTSVQKAENQISSDEKRAIALEVLSSLHIYFGDGYEHTSLTPYMIKFIGGEKCAALRNYFKEQDISAIGLSDADNYFKSFLFPAQTPRYLNLPASVNRR